MIDVTRAYGLTFAFPAGDTAIGRALRTFGEFARPEQDLIAAYMEDAEPGVMVDVGANIGAISLPLAKRFPAWSVIGVEAHRGLAGLYAANAINNDLDNVEWFNVAAGSSEGVLEFPGVTLKKRGNFGGLSSEKPGSAKLEKVRSVPLDEIAPSETRFVKVDVEGHETNVLAGSPRIISEVRPVWLIEGRRSGDRMLPQTAETVALLRGAGYRTFVFFSPFVTYDHLKRTGGEAVRTGDFSIVALPDDRPNLWDLPEVFDASSPWPSDITNFLYLLRYGYRL